MLFRSNDNDAREELRQSLLPVDLKADSGKPVLYRDSSSHNVLPQSFDLNNGVVFASSDATRALENYQYLMTAKYAPEDFTAFVGYPESPEDFEAVFSDHPTAAGLLEWQKNMEGMRTLAKDNKFSVVGMPEMRSFKTKEAFLQQVSRSTGIIWIVAHGNGYSIRLSTGQSIQVTPADIESLRFQHEPFVVVRVCDGGENGFPAAFLKAGARGVWINKGKVYAPDVNQEMSEFVANLSRHTLYDAVKETNAMGSNRKYSNGLTVELRIDDSLMKTNEESAKYGRNRHSD